MTFDNELILIAETFEEDELKNQIASQVENPVLCFEKDVSRSEFYSAARSGLKLSKIFIINKFEYGDEELCKFNGENYKIIKTYDVEEEYIELTCEKV